ncbi:hypothetical protein E2562_024736 [Oryza meyeriana var. granulata]|uniref:Uncharacterized protein n=1 Tax=Oryza meyeriana var. granulata TaxID=110450 RepID=A0A6G1D7P2_9ORYZ|nr:hypothetical protein E2562_024736 [Oryza meyeriana var. granulata]
MGLLLLPTRQAPPDTPAPPAPAVVSDAVKEQATMAAQTNFSHQAGPPTKTPEAEKQRGRGGRMNRWNARRREVNAIDTEPARGMSHNTSHK